MKVPGQIAWTTMNSNPATMSSQPPRAIVASCNIAQVRRSSKLKARQALKKDVASAEMRCLAHATAKKKRPQKLGRLEVAELSWGHEIRGRLHTYRAWKGPLPDTQVSPDAAT
jgi:hypothetical protein